jgi:transcriptional regulator of acetoin/glycerol metabolism
MDKILFEIKITNSCEEIKRLEILNDILKNVGADASFEKEQSGENFLKIRYDKETIRKIKSRKAGAKSIKLKRKISIKEVEKWKEVAEELGVSRSTLFRRIKEAKKQGVDYIE